MYLVIMEDGKTVIWKNPHPEQGLSGQEVWNNYSPMSHTIVFVDSFDEETQCVEDFQVVELCCKRKYERELISENEYKTRLIQDIIKLYYQEFQNTLYGHYDFINDSGVTREYKIGDQQYLDWLDQQRLRILGTSQSSTWPGVDGVRYTFTYNEFIRFSNEIFDRGKNAKMQFDDSVAALPNKTIAELEALKNA